jgi:ribose transport system substrate-binding protein
MNKSRILLVVGLVVAALASTTTTWAKATFSAPSHRLAVAERKIMSPKDLKIAFFLAGTNNTYLQANIRGANDAAKSIGARIHLFSGNWDVTTQANEMQSALSSADYNAWVVEVVDPNQMCAYVKQAVAKGIVVSVANQALCGQKTWFPGTLTFVGGQTIYNYNAWLDWILSRVPRNAKVAMLSGPSLNANTDNFNAAMKTQLKKHPGIRLVSNQQTDYTTETSFKTAQDILQAHRDLNVFIDNYSEVGKGVVSAVQQSGLAGKIKVFDYGGNKWAVQAVRMGQLQMTFPMLPYHETWDAVMALGDYALGKHVSHFINLVNGLKFPGAPFVTRENVAYFHAEY